MEPDTYPLAQWMEIALEEAHAAPAHGDVPIGAVVVHLPTARVIARRHNERERNNDPTAHAEILAMRDAAGTNGGWRLADHALVVTIEPCPMCAGAAWAARVPLLVFGAADPRAGAAGSLYNFAVDPRLNHAAQVKGGIRGEEAAELLQRFFDDRR